MDSKELLRRFRAGGWPGPTQVHAFLGEAPALGRDDIERLLGVLVSKGLPGDTRDQTNRCFVFRTLAERVLDKALFLPYVRALRGADGQILSLLGPLIRGSTVSRGMSSCARCSRKLTAPCAGVWLAFSSRSGAPRFSRV